VCLVGVVARLGQAAGEVPGVAKGGRGGEAVLGGQGPQGHSGLKAAV
jgi:hypothetical protein